MPTATAISMLTVVAEGRGEAVRISSITGARERSDRPRSPGRRGRGMTRDLDVQRPLEPQLGAHPLHDRLRRVGSRDQAHGIARHHVHDRKGEK